MSERFYTAAPIVGNQALLSGSEAHHLIHVLRATVGREVTLFDGSGDEFQARVRDIGRSEVNLDVLERRTEPREAARNVTLAVALPKGDRQQWLVEKATELGVARIVPLVTRRGVALPSSSALERLERHVIEACKQCGRNRLLHIASPQTVSELVAAKAQNGEHWVAHPAESAMEIGPAIARLRQNTLAPLLIAIGPEGGFTTEEIAEMTASQFAEIHLGPRILRIETAALALAAAVLMADLHSIEKK